MGSAPAKFVALRDVLDEVGPACGFSSSDAEVGRAAGVRSGAREKAISRDPVFNVQLPHTRIAGIFRQAAERGVAEPDADDRNSRGPGQ